MIVIRPDWLSITFHTVVPAHSASKTRVNALMLGTHIPESVVMGPRFRGDDSERAHISMSSATSSCGAEWVIQPEEA